MVVMDMDIMDTMANVKLRLSPRLLLIPTFCMVVMDMDIMDTMASVRLRLNPSLLLIPTFCMEDMEVILDMLVLDMQDTDTLMVLDMPTTDKLYLTQHQNGQPNTQTSLFPLSVTTFQCLISFWVTDSRKQ